MDLQAFHISRIEQEIIRKYDKDCYQECQCLLALRRDMINDIALDYQEELLPHIIAFNDALTLAMREMYHKAHRIWDFIKDNKDFIKDDDDPVPGTEVTAKCFLCATYPELHPVQGSDRQDLWSILLDTTCNPLYDNGAAMPLLTLPKGDMPFESLTGMNCPPPNWNEGLNPYLTKDLHLTQAFHNLFSHMNFAITDLIYVRKFETEITIETYKTV